MPTIEIVSLGRRICSRETRKVQILHKKIRAVCKHSVEPTRSRFDALPPLPLYSLLSDFAHPNNKTEASNRKHRQALFGASEDWTWDS